MELVIGSILIGGVFFLWVFGVVVTEVDKRNRRRLLSLHLAKAIVHSQPTWDQVLLIGETDGFGPGATYEIMKTVYRDLLTKENSELHPHRALVEEYFVTHQQVEPFEGLPEPTRIHLERIQESLGENRHLLEPLTGQIRELVSVYERDKKMQRRYAAWGFFVGLAGIIFALYSYFYPQSAG